MRFSLIKKKSKYLNEYEDNEYPYNNSNSFFDNLIMKNRLFLDRPGKIKYAKKHASADRPLHKIKEFTKQTDFCQCCNLPCETTGVIEPFKICGSIDEFSECGIGISLYFYFIIYSIIYLIIIILMLSLPYATLHKYYSNELTIVCNNNIKNSNEYIENICRKYEVDGEIANNTFFYLNQFSSDSVYAYRDFALENTGTYKHVIKTIIRSGIINFLCTLILFMVNIYSLVLLKQKVFIEKTKNCFPSDFTLFISNLDNVLDYYEDYCITKKKIIENDQDKFKDFIYFLKTKIIYNKKNIKIFMILIFVINCMIL